MITAIGARWYAGCFNEILNEIEKQIVDAAKSGKAGVDISLTDPNIKNEIWELLEHLIPFLESKGFDASLNGQSYLTIKWL